MVIYRGMLSAGSYWPIAVLESKDRELRLNGDF